MPLNDFEQYGKLKPPKRRRKKEEIAESTNGKEGEEEPRGYFTRFNGAQVRIKLVGGEILEGALVCNAYNKYDVLLQTEDGTMLIPKHAIGYIKENEGSNRETEGKE